MLVFFFLFTNLLCSTVLVFAAKPTLYVAMLLDIHEQRRSNQSHALKRRFAHARRFVNTEFANASIHVEVKVWPSVITAHCPDKSHRKWEGHDDGTFRGLTIAHMEIWRMFLRRNPSSTDFLLVFEDDVIPAVENSSALAIEYITKMTTDVLYLGYCLANPRQPPCCTHAYALSAVGAKKLGDLVDSCGVELDLQMLDLGRRKWMSWSLPGHHWNQSYATELGRREGFFIRTQYRLDGIYVQAMWEDVPKLIEGDVVKLTSPFDNSKYEYRNGSMHRLPDFLPATTNARSVSEWQLMHFPISQEVSHSS